MNKSNSNAFFEDNVVIGVDKSPTISNPKGKTRSLYVTTPSFEDLKDIFKIVSSPNTFSLYLNGIFDSFAIKVKTSTSVFGIALY